MADAWSFALGAAATFAAQCGVQFGVVPHVEARKRREDRWERAVVDAAELLATEVTSAAAAAAASARVTAALLSEVSPEEKQKRADLVLKWQHEARDKRQAFHDLAGGRFAFLLDRVTTFDADAPALAAVRGIDLRYSMDAAVTPGIEWLMDESLDPEKVDRAWKREAETRSALTKELARLSVRRRPPSTPPRTRVKLRLKRSGAVAAVSRWRIRRQVAREAQQPRLSDD